MGTSLLWQTDTQLHDSVQRQLEWDPEIDAHDVAVTASDVSSRSPDSCTVTQRSWPPNSRSNGFAASAPWPTIRRNAEVDAQHIRVEAVGTIVTLSGEVRSCYQRQEAERAAWAAPGVTRVENLMVVAP